MNRFNNILIKNIKFSKPITHSIKLEPIRLINRPSLNNVKPSSFVQLKQFSSLPSRNEYKRFNPNDNLWNSNLGKLLLGGGLFSFAFYVYHLEEVPITGRRRFMILSHAQEASLAQQSYNEIMAQYGNKILPQYHPHSRMVRNVAQRLIEVVNIPDVQWEVNVIDSPEKNAFVIPGGKIFVFTGIIPIAQNDDGLAAILGHEIAHQMARHISEKMSVTSLIRWVQLGLAWVLDINLINHPFLVQLGFLLPYSRKIEMEADEIGLHLMSKACFNPREASEFWIRMSAQERKGFGIEYLSTHPSSSRRIDQIQAKLPDALITYESSDCHRVMGGFKDAARNIRFNFSNNY